MRSKVDWYRIGVTLVALAGITFAIVLFAPSAQGTGYHDDDKCYEYTVTKYIKKHHGWKQLWQETYDERPDYREGKFKWGGKWYKIEIDKERIECTPDTTTTSSTTSTTTPTTSSSTSTTSSPPSTSSTTVTSSTTTTLPATTTTAPTESTTTTQGPTTTSAPATTTSTVPTELVETGWDASGTCDSMTTFDWGEGVIAVEVFSMTHEGVPQTDEESSTFTFDGQVFTHSVASAHLFTLIPVVQPGFVAVPAQIELIADHCTPVPSETTPEAPETPSTPDLEELPYTGLGLPVLAILGLVLAATGGLIVRKVSE